MIVEAENINVSVVNHALYFARKSLKLKMTLVVYNNLVPSEHEKAVEEVWYWFNEFINNRFKRM